MSNLNFLQPPPVSMLFGMGEKKTFQRRVVFEYVLRLHVRTNQYLDLILSQRRVHLSNIELPRFPYLTYSAYIKINLLG